MRFTYPMLLLSLGLSACSKKECPPLQVTVDGKEIKMVHFLGAEEKGGAGYLVTAFNHDQATCAEMLAGMRTVPDGEVQARAFLAIQESEFITHVVAVQSDHQMMQEVTLVSKPEKEGGLLALCVPDEVAWDGRAGDLEGKPVTVQGLFQGRFCGTKD